MKVQQPWNKKNFKTEGLTSIQVFRLSVNEALHLANYIDATSLDATWCGPFIREIPYLKDLEDKYQKFNIHFVSILIDPIDDLLKWRNFVDKKHLGGIQLYADGDWKSSIITDYPIEGIPRFILIDPEGNIVSADAMRPSNPKLVVLLDELITPSWNNGATKVTIGSLGWDWESTLASHKI